MTNVMCVIAQKMISREGHLTSRLMTVEMCVCKQHWKDKPLFTSLFIYHINQRLIYYLKTQYLSCWISVFFLIIYIFSVNFRFLYQQIMDNHKEHFFKLKLSFAKIQQIRNLSYYISEVKCDCPSQTRGNCYCRELLRQLFMTSGEFSRLLFLILSKKVSNHASYIGREDDLA